MEDSPQEKRAEEINDNMRALASSKKVTIQPLGDPTLIVADEASDAEVANQHAIDAPIANIPTDTEITNISAHSENPNHEYDESGHSNKTLAIILTLIVLGIGGAVAFFAATHQ